MIDHMHDLPQTSDPNQNSSNQATNSTATSAPTGTLSKEKELIGSEGTPFEEIKTDVEIEPGLEKYIKVQKETIDLPPDIKQMGVSQSGPTAPMTQTAAITLPLSDEQIELGLHAKIWLSIRWLAEWCIKQLKRAHLHLKKVAGRVIREKD